MYRLQILTPEDIFFEGNIASLVAPGAGGYLGILTNHAPLMTLLKEGILIITTGNKKQTFYKISNGFIHVKKNEVAILVDFIHSAPAVNWLSGI